MRECAMAEAMATKTQASLPPLREWRDVTLRQFDNEIVPRNEPAVLRGLVDHWPATAAGRDSLDSIRSYLARLDRGARVRTFVGDISMGGRFFYSPQFDAFNFGIADAPFAQLLAVLADESDRRYVYMGSTHTSEILPGFEQENPLGLVQSKSTCPRIWIGNSSRIATHFDESDNVACVVSGTRRFTLFPPEQMPNLYLGPFEFTPAGTPVSMVHVSEPDADRYPLFASALAKAEEAELLPGDAIFIPRDWFHHVEALERFNVLVNYWWDPNSGSA